MELQFEWDEAKNRRNIAKHGISFEDARYVFADPLHLETYDRAHSIDEDRWRIIGDIGKIVRVSVTYRGDVIRVISAVEAGSAERKEYGNY
ncbi:hypothetical protein FACS189485_00750 [Spirochaetia bacterium]|nr:hypothetical protein FACS189485_00750 [Spirochaetia bacterium]